MLDTIKRILGFGPSVDYAQLIKQGAIILDVRTKAEYKQGHIKGSQNIPLNSLQSQFDKLGRDQTFITCCASGMRSASAKSLLKSNDFLEVYNGGSWISLQNKI